MYYGMTYNKYRDCIIYKKLKDITDSFDNEYLALKFANKCWFEENEDEGEYSRLLVVVDADNIEKVAFFEFTDYKVCEMFATKQEKIIWSSDDEQIWNGNGKLMIK